MLKHPQLPSTQHGNGSDLANLNQERTASQCVCCGGVKLDSSPAILMPFIAHRIFGWAPVVIDEFWGLKTIANGTAYTICKSLYCLNCGFLFLDMRFSDKELDALYTGYRDQAYTDLRESYEPGYTERNDFLKSGVPYIEEIEQFLAPHVQLPVSILDWGGDTGKNTPFKRNNTSIDIYDISNKAVLPSASIVSKEEAFSKQYDLVVCCNVLEHVPYPSIIIEDIKHTMNARSVLYIEVPYEDLMRTTSTNPHLKKKHWHEHINFFSEQSLIQLIQNCGLEVLAINKLCTEKKTNSAYVFQLACQLKK